MMCLGYKGISPSALLSVQIRVRPVILFWFDIGLPYLAHWCITIRGCVAYICDLDTNRHLTSRSNLLDLLRCFHVQPVKTYCNWFFLLLGIFDKVKKTY